MNAEPPTARVQTEHQSRRPGYVKRSSNEKKALPEASEHRFKPRYSLKLFCLVCLLASMLVAFVGVFWQLNRPHEFVGFPADAPRQDGFIAPGQLTHVVKQDVHAPNGLNVRLTVRIELNHDRVFSHSIDGCLTEIWNVSYSLSDSLSEGDPTFVEEFVARHLRAFNGTSAVRSVELLDYRTIPKPAAGSRSPNPAVVLLTFSCSQLDRRDIISTFPNQ